MKRFYRILILACLIAGGCTVIAGTVSAIPVHYNVTDAVRACCHLNNSGTSCDIDDFGADQFALGMNVELEHGGGEYEVFAGVTDVTGDDGGICLIECQCDLKTLKTAKIVLAHLNEFDDYYWRLLDMEHLADVVYKIDMEDHPALEKWPVPLASKFRKVGKGLVMDQCYQIDDFELVAGDLLKNAGFTNTWDDVGFTPEQYRMGMDVELEHGYDTAWHGSPETDVTGDSCEFKEETENTAKVVLAHFGEFPDYYYRLKVMEIQAEAQYK